MKTFAKIAFALVAAASCVAAGAQTWDSQADQERRARNRDEAIAAWEHQQHQRSNVAYDDRETPHKSAREVTHEEASKTRSVTHHQLDKMRHFGAEQNARFHAPDHPVHEVDKTPTAIGSNKP
jgi:hypothetical protein